jgi:hypothetical protein
MSQDSESKFASFLAARKVTTTDKESGTESSALYPTPSRGRRNGKRRDPAFEQVTAYIRRDTHHAVKLTLLKDGRNRQFSDLVEMLLADWLRSAMHNSELPCM